MIRLVTRQVIALRKRKEEKKGKVHNFRTEDEKTTNYHTYPTKNQSRLISFLLFVPARPPVPPSADCTIGWIKHHDRVIT